MCGCTRFCPLNATASFTLLPRHPERVRLRAFFFPSLVTPSRVRQRVCFVGDPEGICVTMVSVGVPGTARVFVYVCP